MRVFEDVLDTVIESTTHALTAPNPNGVTATYQPHPDMNQQMVQAVNMQQQLRTQHYAAMPIDQKIDLALQKAAEAEKVAYRTYRDLSAINTKLDKSFDNLSKMIERVGSGKQATEPDPPGSSIFDDGSDPESIF